KAVAQDVGTTSHHLDEIGWFEFERTASMPDVVGVDGLDGAEVVVAAVADRDRLGGWRGHSGSGLGACVPRARWVARPTSLPDFRAGSHPEQAGHGRPAVRRLTMPVAHRPRKRAGTITSAGNATSATRTRNWARRKGQMPTIRVSTRVRVVPATTFSTVPTGGVISPSEALITNSTPK